MLEPSRYEVRPFYDKRITNAAALTPNRAVRRYYWNEGRGWLYTDYVIAGAIVKRDGHLRVPVRVIGDVERKRHEVLILSDMGVIPQRRGKFNPVTYTVPL